MSVRGHFVRAFKTTITCVYTDGSGPSAGNTLALPTKVRVRKSGRFSYSNGGDVVKGRVKGGRITGKIDFTAPNFDETGETPPCKASGVRFKARFRKHPLYRNGRYKGTSSCAAGFSNCPEQSSVLTMRVRTNGIVNLSTEVICDEDSGSGTHSVLFHLDRLKLDWYGHFAAHSAFTGSTTDFSLRAVGLVRGTHLTGQLEYVAGSNDHVHTCEAFPDIQASRVGS